MLRNGEDGGDAMWAAWGRDRYRTAVTPASGLVACLACCLALAGPATAGPLTDGPLAGPDAAAPPMTGDAKTGRARRVTRTKTPATKMPATKTRAAKAANATAADLDDGRGPAMPPAAKPAPRKPVSEPATDPLSLGMKWNGSNDSAEQTRIQNYGGTAAGTGASVGLNYHF